MKIRKAKPSDINQILKIIKSNNPNYPIKQSRKEISEMFSNSLIKPNYLVVEEKKVIIAFGGFSRSWTDANIANIFWINVHKEFQRKGIGKKLIDEIIKNIIRFDKPKIKLIILSSNKIDFWKKLGFKRLNKYDKDYWLMGKVLE